MGSRHGPDQLEIRKEGHQHSDAGRGRRMRGDTADLELLAEEGQLQYRGKDKPHEPLPPLLRSVQNEVPDGRPGVRRERMDPIPQRQ